MNSGISGGDKLQNLAKILSSAVTVVIGAAKIPRFMGLVSCVVTEKFEKKRAGDKSKNWEQSPRHCDG